MSHSYESGNKPRYKISHEIFDRPQWNRCELDLLKPEYELAEGGEVNENLYPNSSNAKRKQKWKANRATGLLRAIIS